MLITVSGNSATTIEDGVIKRILNLYPEEKLQERPTFSRAFRFGILELKELKDESAKILIPWQMFFLTESNLDIQLQHIENQRKHKVSAKLLSKRKGSGNITSKRIIDRLIRQQNFLTEHIEFPENIYCGSIVRMSTAQAVEYILQYLEIDRSVYWEYEDKDKVLDFFIKKIESKNVNVCRGVLTNKILPTAGVVVTSVYKNTSGFVIKDNRIPFIFLPNEINPDELVSRQIYTLVYLFVIIGLSKYDYYLEKNFRVKSIKTTRIEDRIHAITSEVLMPKLELEQYKDQMSLTIRDRLCSKLKVTPSALVTVLRKRGIINEAQYEKLKPPEFVPGKPKKSSIRSPLMSTSIKKFCGNHTYKAICFAINAKSIANTQAQYLIFGSINKNGFRRFCAEITK